MTEGVLIRAVGVVGIQDKPPGTAYCLAENEIDFVLYLYLEGGFEGLLTDNSLAI